MGPSPSLLRRLWSDIEARSTPEHIGEAALPPVGIVAGVFSASGVVQTPPPPHSFSACCLQAHTYVAAKQASKHRCFSIALNSREVDCFALLGIFWLSVHSVFLGLWALGA